VGKCTVDNAFQCVHQFQRHLKGQTIAQGNNALNTTSGNAVGKGINIFLVHARHIALIVKVTSTLSRKTS